MRRVKWGHRGRGRQWNYDNEQPPRPSGLKGREIGLYYRDMGRKRRNIDYVFHFSIPSNIERQVKTEINQITNTEEGKQVVRNFMTQFNESPIFAISSRSSIEQLPLATASLEDKCPSTDEAQLSINCSNFSLHCESAFSSSNPNDSIPKPKLMDEKPPTEHKLNETPNNALKPRSSIEELPPATVFSSQENLFKCPAIPKSDLSRTSPVSSSSSISMDEPKKLKLMKDVPGSRKERHISDQYKYGYEDIITGSFLEKLEESLKNRKYKPFELLNLNEACFMEYEDMTERSGYKNMLKFREKLPTYLKSKEVLEAIDNNQVIVISGETGCGKSTQVPQIILDDAMLNRNGANAKIIVTQPRRIAAISLAERVAKERGENVGNSVGYMVRLEKIVARAECSINYCTTGVLLNELETNQALNGISHVVVDEVHERDFHVDMTMCLLKLIISKRKDLKVILMSATLDSDRLSSYFCGAPLLHIEGVAYPVEQVYLETIVEMLAFSLPEEQVMSRQHGKGHFRPWERRNNKEEQKPDLEHLKWLDNLRKTQQITNLTHKTLLDPRLDKINMSLIVSLLKYISLQGPGAILVFLPGISTITKLMKEITNTNLFPREKFNIYPLHSKLTTSEQNKIFSKSKEGIRKIIIATNIAETSITIDDVVYVIDCAQVKIKGLNVDTYLSTLTDEWVTKANLRQRRGRAGRCQPGICYHLITSFKANKLDERPLPELQRSDLLEPVLILKKLRLGNAATALTAVMDPPDPSTVSSAVNHLTLCGALNKEEILTPLGWHMARLPAHPAAGKLLILGSLFGCVDRAASVAAVWGFKDPFPIIIGKTDVVDESKRKFAMGEPSDQVALSEAIIAFENSLNQKDFAYSNFLSYYTLNLLVDMKEQFFDNLRQMGFLVGDPRTGRENRNHNNISLFKAVIAASLFPNVARVRWTGMHNPRKAPKPIVHTPEGKIFIHPGSVMGKNSLHKGKARPQIHLCDKPGQNWVTYWLKQKSDALYLIDVNFVYTLPIMFFGNISISKLPDNENERIIKICDYKVKSKKDLAMLILEMRSLLDYVLMNKVTDGSEHSYQSDKFENDVLNAVIRLITSEDEQIGDDDYYESSDSDSEAGSSSRY